MKTPTLHYLYDPFCGWCYGAAPMISASQEISGLKIEAHGIGMLSGNKAKTMSPEWRDFVRPHEERIHVYSKQQFGDPYVRGVQEHQDLRLDSSPPIAAMLVAQELSGRGVEMLKRLQTAYYVEGKAIAERDVIADIASELGYERETFVAHLDGVLNTDLEQHITESKELLHTLGAHGVPAFVVEIDGTMHTLDFGLYIARPALFKEDIEVLLRQN
jgi:putative protein-disulfide isomerase